MLVLLPQFLHSCHCPLSSFLPKDDEFFAIAGFGKIVAFRNGTSQQCGILDSLIGEEEVDPNVWLFRERSVEIERYSSEDRCGADDDAAAEERPSHSCQQPWLLKMMPFHKSYYRTIFCSPNEAASM